MFLWETRSLLIGESADPEVVKGIYDEVSKDPEVASLKQPLTMQMAPYEILVALNVEFKTLEKTSDIATIIQRVENNIKKKYPQVRSIFIEATCFSKLSEDEKAGV